MIANDRDHAIAGNGAREHGRGGRPDLLSLRRVRFAGGRGEPGRSFEGGWAAGGFGGQPVSAHGAGHEGFRSWRMDRWTCGWITTRGKTAADLVNHSDEKTLADLIYQLGEERRARRIARAIVRARPLRSTLHLADVVERAVPRTGRLHPATKTFHGAANGGQRRTRGVAPAAGNRSRLVEERRTNGGDQFHVDRRPAW